MVFQFELGFIKQGIIKPVEKAFHKDLKKSLISLMSDTFFLRHCEGSALGRCWDGDIGEHGYGLPEWIGRVGNSQGGLDHTWRRFY